MEDNFKKVNEDDIRRKIMKKSIRIEDLIRDKYFQTLFGSYLLYMQVCEPLQVDVCVQEHLSKFPEDYELLRSFLEFMNDEKSSMSTPFSKTSSTFDMNLAGKQLSAAANGKRK